MVTQPEHEFDTWSGSTEPQRSQHARILGRVDTTAASSRGSRTTYSVQPCHGGATSVSAHYDRATG